VSSGATILIVKLFDYFFPKRKERVETMSLSDSEQRAKDEWCNKRLETMEKRYNELEEKMLAQEEKAKELIQENHQLHKEVKAGKAEITYLRIQLAAWKK
jgi:hypothetical protein